MAGEIDWSIGETGYDSTSQGELNDYLQNGETIGYGNDVGYSDTGEEIQPWQNVSTTGDTTSGTAFNASELTKLFEKSPVLSGLLKTLGAAGIGSLADKLMGVTGGPGGYKGSIPDLVASRQQYAVPMTGSAGTYNPSDSEIRDYITRPGMSDAMVARGMNQFGISPDRIAGITGLPAAAVNQRYQAALGPNMMSRRPGSGGVTYFSPMQYSKAGAAPVKEEVAVDAAPVEVAAAGGLMGYAGGGIANLGSYSDGGRLLKGPGDGVSDSIPAMIGKRQPARLADGEFVIPARIVSELGNGSTEAGARKLYAMMDRIKKARGKAKNIAADTKSDKHLPA
jgi:hypothetical protein